MTQNTLKRNVTMLKKLLGGQGYAEIAKEYKYSSDTSAYS